MKEFYVGKTILVTGSTGFKGSWLSLWLHHMGAKVIGYGLKPNTDPNFFSALHLDNTITNILGDINCYNNINDVCEMYKPELIFHLAAQPLVRESYVNPVHTIQINTIGTAHILELVRVKEYIKGAVIITTDKVYENKEWLWPYRENDRLGGFDPYSASKAMAELVINCYQQSFFSDKSKKIATVRAGNVIGCGDRSKDRLIPDIVKSLQNKEEVIIRNPHAIRPWQYVLEALYGYLIIGQKMFESDRYIGAYNFGPDISDSLQVIDIVQKAIEILGIGSYKIENSQKDMHEAGILLLDNTKAKTLLGWKPKYTLQQALERTFAGYQVYYNGGNIRDFALAEINNFL